VAFEFELPPAPNQDVKPEFGPQDLVRRSASSVPLPERKLTEVAKLIDVSKCIGCKACQVACLEWNDRTERIGLNYGVYDNPVDLTAESFTVMRFTEWINPETQNLEWLIRKDGCMHCEDPGCLKACPSPGAIVQYSNGIVDFDHEKCIGCGYCIKGCPFDIPRISAVDNKAYKCTLCSDRVSVGLEPACAKACPTQAISFGTKKDMVEFAQTRITDLNERGYDKAGLYDPPGVDGTHVMYVLQHADRPELYADLPKDPKISPLVEAWKGATKPVALIGLGLTALFGFLHYVSTGPNEVEETDEEQAKKAIDQPDEKREGR
jgi:formate dehydrogenase iron-sulfur subunit